MASTVISDLVGEKVDEVRRASASEAWAACASVWAHMFMLSTPGWRKWPEMYAAALTALREALSYGVLLQINNRAFDSQDQSRSSAIQALEGFEIEDDGSPEWQLVLDVVAVLMTALASQDPVDCLEISLQTYLEGVFSNLTNELATAAGTPISQKQAEDDIADHPKWLQAVGFVKYL